MNVAARSALSLLARAVVVVVLAGPAVGKVLDYGGQVAFFESLGLPAPGLLVALSAAVELAALVGVGLGVAGRLLAVPLVVNMLVAVVAGAPNPANLAVLAGALVVLALGTGPYSLWSPAVERRMPSPGTDSDRGGR
ncbi:DoxX family protein [Halomarina oriensis]|uniref:DoxX family membrane protein n=1 Tax=Halomarina oriensis TaxID=671145 RepID=A0A6B0GL90_9EURY|nr:DoxX family protein [Halomarina oriensis]MWG34219.1 DoxX family membrane protein [Halomarina oriensis]